MLARMAVSPLSMPASKSPVSRDLRGRTPAAPRDPRRDRTAEGLRGEPRQDAARAGLLVRRSRRPADEHALAAGRLAHAGDIERTRDIEAGDVAARAPSPAASRSAAAGESDCASERCDERDADAMHARLHLHADVLKRACISSAAIACCWSTYFRSSGPPRFLLEHAHVIDGEDHACAWSSILVT